MAAVDYFLKIDGISGESTDEAHKGEIEVESFSWGVSQATTRLGAGAAAGRAVFQDLRFTSFVSKASPNLMLKCATGAHLKDAVLTARNAGGEQQEFLKITLSDVLVSSYQTSASANPGPPDSPTDAIFIGLDQPTDAVSLSYGSAKLTEGPQQHIDILPWTMGVLRYDATTGSFEVIADPEGPLTVGTQGGTVGRAVQEFDVRDLLGLLTGPFPGGRLHLSVTEVREAASPPPDAPGKSGDAPQPHLHFDVVAYTPADGVLTMEDLTRNRRRIGTLTVDPRGDPATFDADLGANTFGDGTFGLRLQLRGAPITPPDPNRSGPTRADAPTDDEQLDERERRGRDASAAFTLSVAFDTA